MKYIKTPTGDIFEFDDCEIFEDNETLTQKELADLLFEKTGILVADAEGGENKIGSMCKYDW